VLRNDSANRRKIIESSEQWKTGDFLVPKKVATDIVHGAKFANSPLARKAGLGETRRVRIGLTVWNDDFTVRATRV
jgi:predicted RecA/RadA family phage recombinase